eukprot:4222009-Prymnesium_polylepis.3
MRGPRQAVPWADQPLVYYKKFRVYFQSYNACAPMPAKPQASPQAQHLSQHLSQALSQALSRTQHTIVRWRLLSVWPPVWPPVWPWPLTPSCGGDVPRASLSLSGASLLAARATCRSSGRIGHRGGRRPFGVRCRPVVRRTQNSFRTMSRIRPPARGTRHDDGRVDARRHTRSDRKLDAEQPNRKPHT